MSLRERLIALADRAEGSPSPISRRIALAAARMALEEAERECGEYVRNETAESIADSIRALRDGLEDK